MATATASHQPRFAPEDPTLPKPWKGLVDGKTGYLYFWNPETNVTQYERPVASSYGNSVSSRSSSGYVSSSVQGQQSSHEQRRDGGYSNDDGDKYSNGDRSMQVGKHGDFPHAVAAGSTAGHGRLEVGSAGLSAESYRRKHEISVSGDSVPPPFSTFEASGFPDEILKEMRYLLQGGANVATKAGFSAPTPIQAQSWPIALQGRDIVAIAKTGSGKTLGYLIPGFIHLKRCRNNSQMGPTVLVLSPTRELATQIQDEAVKFGKSSRISCTSLDKVLTRIPCPVRGVSCPTWPYGYSGAKWRVRCLYGGAPKGPQLRELDRGADIVVATPGRLNDILEARRVSLHQVSYLVLDEADRMLDMGFEPQIRKIVKEVPTRRQTLMFTATWPKEVRKIAADLLSNPVQVNIGNVDELVANKSITQHVELLSPMEKQRRLEQILRSQEPGSKIIIFCATKKMCDLLARNLSRQFGAAAIHGDKSQSERDHVLNQFRTGRSPVLVATDVAARGLDIKDIRVNADSAVTEEADLCYEKSQQVDVVPTASPPSNHLQLGMMYPILGWELSWPECRSFLVAKLEGKAELPVPGLELINLDMFQLRVVINYDFPTGIEDYVHRIGRTGRAGATGVAYTFFCDQDGKYASDLVKILEGANQRVPQEVRDIAVRGGGMGRPRGRWGSGTGGRDGGRGGRNDSGYGGRDGGRGRDRYDRGYNDSYDTDGRGNYDRGYQSKNSRNGDGYRDRSRSRSPSARSGWSARDSSQGWSRERSRSPERSDKGGPVKSFHQMMMERTRSSPSRHQQAPPVNNNDDKRLEWGKSTAAGHGSGGAADGVRPYREEDSGIPTDRE
ncbi:hypothetical protein Cgig2_016753 [Carnegiea gigantea]|uniref:RNA helicase n=1 Tax=Carnegiea gigantea TaxID=171969 RepID=A0A9Q1QRT3_9CARY|nr:hypothetical protein Cgig2_016753 [Carnegiea gigantea]